jgi:hypothetical protein
VSARIEADDWAAWGELFEFASSAYRLETLQTYAEPDEAAAVARFLAGQDPDLDTSWWEALVARHRAAGRTMTRVRVLSEPLSDYARFQLPYYARFARAGEDIRIIATPIGSWPAGLPRRDYWLFDDTDLWALTYTAAGTFEHADLIVDAALIAEHRHWRDRALSIATPLADYLATSTRRAS